MALEHFWEWKWFSLGIMTPLVTTQVHLLNLCRLQSVRERSQNILGGNSLSPKDLDHISSKILSYKEIPLASLLVVELFLIFPFFTQIQFFIQQILSSLLSHRSRSIDIIQTCQKHCSSLFISSPCFYFQLGQKTFSTNDYIINICFFRLCHSYSNLQQHESTHIVNM